jgi:peptidoglycan/LPS O-acetylase OafA/YrhL
MTSPNASAAKVAGLDHLRALAITLVFIFHYRLFPHPDWIDTIGSFGWTGVDLFFVLSGYLIASQIFNQVKQDKFSLYEFFIKRFFRILPAYWVVLALYFLVPAFKEWEALPPLWKFLSFTQNFGLDLRTQRTFSHAWSLCIEEQFYLLLPLSVLLLKYLNARKRSIYLIIALFIATITARWLSWNYFIVPVIDTDAFGMLWYKHIYYPTYNRLDGLLVGVGIAGVYVYYPKTKAYFEKHSNIALVLGLALAAIAYFVCMVQYTFAASVWGFAIVAVAYGMMVICATAQNGLLNKFRSNITSTIATLSYSLYLVHKATIHLTQDLFTQFGIEQESTVMFLACTITSLLGALILNKIIEKPFLKLKEKYLNTLAADNKATH